MANNLPTDAELVGKALAGDREAFACLYDRYARLVRAVVYGVALDWPMVQDMTQECFLRAYKNLARLREADRFGRWIVGIARQVAKERRRTIRRDRHQFIGSDDALEVASDADVVGAIESAEETELVLRRVAELPERERIAIHVFFLQECDARQAAELLGLSRSGVYALLERAMARLATQIRRHEVKKEAK
ncbi:MAG: sigma-70 family RNA polymerase sigma factor [Thermoguttaceae bacterium]|jgi:RNA polymerase sigma-70 factor (ECF subfamily)